MFKFSRRDFLKLSSVLFAFVPVARALSKVGVPKINRDVPAPIESYPVKDEDLIVEKYESGILKGINNDNIVIENSKGKVALYTFDTTELWDGIKWVGEITAEIGDRIIAWGNRNSDGSLDVEKLYVNIVNLIGDVSNVKTDKDSAEFVNNDRRQGPVMVVVKGLTDIDDGKGKRLSYKDRPLLPNNGQFVQVIGREMRDGIVTGVIIYLL